MSGWRSKLRSKLNRLVRRAKGYTKSVEILKYMLAIALEECLNQPLKFINTAEWEYPPADDVSGCGQTGQQLGRICRQTYFAVA